MLKSAVWALTTLSCSQCPNWCVPGRLMNPPNTLSTPSAINGQAPPILYDAEGAVLDDEPTELDKAA